MPSSVNLGKRLEATMDKFVAEGRYGSRSEVLREGVRLVEEREKALAALDAELLKGIEAAKHGELTPIEDAAAQVKANIRRRAAKRAA